MTAPLHGIIVVVSIPSLRHLQPPSPPHKHPMTNQPLLQPLILPPVLYSNRAQASLLLPFHVLTHVLQAALQRRPALELLVAKDTAAALRRFAHALIAALSYVVESCFDCRDFALCSAFLAAVVFDVCGRCCLGVRVHSPDMLDVQVFAVEVVGSRGRVGALVAAPEAELEVLRRGVAFPFVFGAEDCCAAVWSEWAEESTGWVVRGR